MTPFDFPFQTQCSCVPWTYHIQQMILGHTIAGFFPLQSIYPVKTKMFIINNLVTIQTADKELFSGNSKIQIQTFH